MMRSMASSKSDRLDRRLVAPGREQRRLVDEVGEVGAGKPGRARRDDLEVDALGQLHVLDVDPQDRFAALHVGLVDEHLTIEAARAEQRRVEHLRAGWSRP